MIDEGGSLVGPQPELPFAKRVFDVALVVLTLPIWLPVLLGTGLAICVLSGFPILYRSHRRVFLTRSQTILKFRVMVRDAEQIANRDTIPVESRRFLNIAPNSPLYTRIGRIVERCSLTELPQFLHVVRGGMSVVGNRPLPENVIAALKIPFPTTEERFLTRCGLCGPIQLVGRDELTDEQRLAVEIAYCRWCLTNYSMFVDFKILLFTVLRCLRLRPSMSFATLSEWFSTGEAPAGPPRRSAAAPG